MKANRWLFHVLLMTISISGISALGQTSSGIDPEALLTRILAVEAEQREKLKDVTFDAVYIEGEYKAGVTEFIEKLRFTKRIAIKYLPDTAWYHEQYLEYYLNGKPQSAEDRDKEAAERAEKKVRRKAYDISYPMLRALTPARRSLYDIAYKGVTPEPINDHICHRFSVTARQPADTLINGDYYFEAETFHLIRVDFSPSQLVKRTMFRLSELSMRIDYTPTSDGIWLPRQFTISGKGKAMLFITVRFGGTEYYRNPIVNSGLNDNLFEVRHEQ